MTINIKIIIICVLSLYELLFLLKPEGGILLVMKTNQLQEYEEKFERKFSSLRFPPKPIPKHVLSRTIKIFTDSNDTFWLNKNSSCAPPVNYELNNHSDTHKKLNLARKCILGRDWHNLAKLLTSNLVGDSLIQKSSYPVFSEYVSIFLTMEDPELLQKLQQTITPSASTIKQQKLKMLDNDNNTYL